VSEVPGVSEVLPLATAAEPGYLTPEDVAKLLNVAPTTVTRLAKADPTMPCLRLGHRTLRFPRERLMVWLRSREQGPVSRPRAKKLLLSPANPASSNGVASA
jgi:excisionase family DNA binding protein